jgi:uncharacterized protein
MVRARVWLFAAAGIAAAGCPSPTVTLATEKPIEIKIDLRHEVRVHIDREVDELIDSEAARVKPRGITADDEDFAQAAKARDVLGEQADGYLGARTPNATPEDHALIQRVNASRRERYLALAQESGVPVAQIEKSAGAHRIEDAPPGEWVRTPGGDWIEKSDATVVKVQDQPDA